MIIHVVTVLKSAFDCFNCYYKFNVHSMNFLEHAYLASRLELVLSIGVPHGRVGITKGVSVLSSSLSCGWAGKDLDWNSNVIEIELICVKNTMR